MDALKRTLLSLVLVCFSSFNSFGKETEAPSPALPVADMKKETPVKEYPENLEDYLNLFEEKFIETGERNKRLFKDIEVGNIIWKYYNVTPSGYRLADYSFYLTEKEEDEAEEYATDFLEDTLRETRYSVGWIDDLEEDIKDSVKDVFTRALDGSKEDYSWLYGLVDSVNNLFRYGISFKGKETDGHTYSPTLNEERRLENRERRERTGAEFVVPEFGRKYIFDVDFGYEPEGWTLKELFGGFKTEIALSDFQIFGHKFNRAELECESDQEAKASITKLIGNGWHYKISSRFEKFPEPYNISLTFIRETTLKRSEFGFTESLPSRLRASVNYDNRNNETSWLLDYVLRF